MNDDSIGRGQKIPAILPGELGHTDPGDGMPAAAVTGAVEPERSAGDLISHPPHYKQHPVVECIDVAEHFPFNVGNVIKYAFRAGKKGSPEDAVKDLRKAAWYANREADRLEKEQKK